MWRLIKIIVWLAVAAILIFIVWTVTAAAGDIKSPDAKAAHVRFEKEKKNLDEAYARELKTITKTYAAALMVTRKAALEANDLDEAQAIGQEIKDAEERAKASEPEAPAPLAAGKLTAKDLIGKEFLFLWCPTPHIFTFNKDGTIHCPTSPTDRFWQLGPNGELAVMDGDKRAHKFFMLAKNSMALDGRHVTDPNVRGLALIERPKKK